MKKLLIFSLFIFAFVFNSNVVEANEYLAYQEIEFTGYGNEFLSDYSKSQYDKYYGFIDNRRFWGWNTYTVINSVHLTYTKETMYIIVNEGTTPITQTYYIKSEDETKKQYSVSGNIELSIKGKIDGFALGLEDSIKTSITAVVTSSVDEKFEVKVLVDPGTKLTVQIKGEGKLSNGVARYYRFFRNVKKGGWEVFVITTEYYSMTKVMIDDRETYTNED
ncbi:MAG: hypothetical protein QM489_03185 [Candidatus Izemoplasma sp.]